MRLFHFSTILFSFLAAMDEKGRKVAPNWANQVISQKFRNWDPEKTSTYG